jgi:hypothetical protein
VVYASQVVEHLLLLKLVLVVKIANVLQNIAHSYLQQHPIPVKVHAHNPRQLDHSQMVVIVNKAVIVPQNLVILSVINVLMHALQLQ